MLRNRLPVSEHIGQPSIQQAKDIAQSNEAREIESKNVEAIGQVRVESAINNGGTQVFICGGQHS
jgi:hypothetical protein